MISIHILLTALFENEALYSPHTIPAPAASSRYPLAGLQATAQNLSLFTNRREQIYSSKDNLDFKLYRIC
jgi:hypothetical protein